MREMICQNNTTSLYVRIDGSDDRSAPTIVFANSLGATIDIWDDVITTLPDGLRIIRYDMRGHGRSDIPDGPYTMGQLVSDAEAVCDATQTRDAMFVGLSVGGMVAQGLAVKRPEMIRALVLSNTAAKIGNPSFWAERVNDVQTLGMDGLAHKIIPRWFGRDFLKNGDTLRWHAMLSQTNAQGYAGICAAIAGTDFYTPTSGLRIPTLGIAGGQDASTPADLVRETVDLIPGSQMTVMSRCGHLPCVEDPIGYSDILRSFIANTGHIT